MALELDMVVDANPANAPLGKAIGLSRQRVEVGPIELFEQRPAGDTEAPDPAFVIELPQQLADRGIEFAKTIEAPAIWAHHRLLRRHGYGRRSSRPVPTASSLRH